MSREIYFDLDGLPQDLLVCNCAGCRRLLMSSGQYRLKGYPPIVRGRMNDRPYCSDCLESHRPKGGHLVNNKLPKEDSPSLDNWIKMIEGRDEV